MANGLRLRRTKQSQATSRRHRPGARRRQSGGTDDNAMKSASKKKPTAKKLKKLTKKQANTTTRANGSARASDSRSDWNFTELPTRLAAHEKNHHLNKLGKYYTCDTPDAAALDKVKEIDLRGVEERAWRPGLTMGHHARSMLMDEEYKHKEYDRTYSLRDYESTSLPRALPFATKKKKKKRRLVQRAAAPTALQTLRAWQPARG